MRSIEDKGCSMNCPTEENTDGHCINFEFHKSNRPSHHHHRTPLGKPTPSKWDDAQKWLVNLSRGEKNHPAKASPRSSNADDRRLIPSVPKDEREDGYERESECVVETKNVDCSNKSVVRSICLRDMGTEMTPMASKEPSRAATPVKAASPVSSTPSPRVEAGRACSLSGDFGRDEGERDGVNVIEIKSDDDQCKKMDPLEIKALAWEEAERAKYMARYKNEEVKIQAWENHEKRKAEMENRKVEVKAERLKSRAKERYNNKIAAARRIAEEKRANAEAKLNEKAMKTSERADYIRRRGHLPSYFSFKFPSCCCW